MIKDYEVLFQEKENKIMAMKKMSVQYYNERLGRKNGYDEFSKMKNLHINQKQEIEKLKKQCSEKDVINFELEKQILEFQNMEEERKNQASLEKIRSKDSFSHSKSNNFKSYVSKKIQTDDDNYSIQDVRRKVIEVNRLINYQN